MTLGVDHTTLVALVLVLVVGSVVQSLVGLGLGLVAAPVVTLLDPSLMPVLMLVLAALLPLFTLIRSHDEIDWSGLGWVLPARVPGTVVGVLLLAMFSEQALGLAVSLVVLLAIGVSVTFVRLPVRPVTLVAAGVVSGITGTTTSIGGPPVALLYQHRNPAQIRSTLAVMFTVGAVISLLGIWLGGRLEPRVLLVALLLAPALALGAWIGHRLRGAVPDRSVRYAVLVVSAGSAVALLVRSVV